MDIDFDIADYMTEPVKRAEPKPEEEEELNVCVACEDKESPSLIVGAFEFARNYNELNAGVNPSVGENLSDFFLRGVPEERVECLMVSY